MWGVFLLLPLVVAGASPEELVNIRQGTYSTYSVLSTGNTLPLVGLPWGHSHWAPESGGSLGNWWFNNDVPKLNGVRCTHQPSPWIREWGWFRIFTGYDDEGNDKAQAYSPDGVNTTWSPYHFGTDILGMGTTEGGNARIDLTASTHGALIRFKWPAFDAASGFPQRRYIRIDVPVPRTRLAGTVDGGKFTATGGTRQAQLGSVGSLANYTMFFHAEFLGATPVSFTALTNITVWYPVTANEVNVRVGVSLLSAEVAASRLEDQVPSTKDFDTLMAEHKAVWKNHLSVIEIIDSGFSNDEDREEEILKTFYSSMYRALMFPRNIGEMVDGKQFHWSPYHPEGGIFEGPLSTDSGFWDSYHTMYTFLQLFFPDQLGIILDGYVNAFNEGGWLPQWGSPGYRGSMVGTMSDVSFADAIVKGFDNFNITGALEAMKKNAFTLSSTDGMGRRGLRAYMDRGFIPRGTLDGAGAVHEVISRTLNHAFADWAIVQAANAVDDQTVFTEEEIKTLETRSSNWKNLFNQETGFFQARTVLGNFVDGFDPYLWGGDLTEGGPWQFRFYAPHDPLGLAGHLGGPEKMCELLEEMNTHPSYVHRQSGNYGNVIHEMIEVPLNVWAQHSQNNQPAHHSLFMFIAAYDGVETRRAGCLNRGHHWIRATMLHAYNSTHFSGDEDNGEMGAWFVLNALGLYDMTPASGEYMLGIPLFKEVKATMLKAEKTIRGSDCNKDEKCVVASAATYKDDVLVEDLTKFKIPFNALSEADSLVFEFEDPPTTTSTTTSTTTTTPGATTTTALTGTQGDSSGPRASLCAAVALAAMVAAP